MKTHNDDCPRAGALAPKGRLRHDMQLDLAGFNLTCMTDGVPDKIREQVLEQIVAGRVADAREDVGSVVAFLSSKGAAYVTGSKIGVSGGLHMNVAS